MNSLLTYSNSVECLLHAVNEVVLFSFFCFMHQRLYHCLRLMCALWIPAQTEPFTKYSMLEVHSVFRMCGIYSVYKNLIQWFRRDVRSLSVDWFVTVVLELCS